MRVSSQRNSLKRKTHPDAWQTTLKPVFQHNDTRADMNPVATFTQEHPHCHLGRHSPSMLPCITRGVTSPQPAHHSPHMRPGEIQDESRKHEHQKVHERYLFQDLWCCEPSVLPAQRAVYDRQKRCGLLTTAKRLQLNNMVSTMNSHTVDRGSTVRHRKISVARSAAYQEARGTEK